jgi:proteasome lid subunit RPN8/RPN11
MSLIISQSLLEKIREYGESAYPNECCGLLVGKWDNPSKSATRLRPAANARQDSPRNRYLIEPMELLEADREARQTGLDIVGVYHSHPDHPARPSDFDREHAFPRFSYIIVNITEGAAGELTSWLLRDDRAAFDSEDLLTTA